MDQSLKMHTIVRGEGYYTILPIEIMTVVEPGSRHSSRVTDSSTLRLHLSRSYIEKTCYKTLVTLHPCCSVSFTFRSTSALYTLDVLLLPPFTTLRVPSRTYSPSLYVISRH
jgi:hypothetical protein